VLPGIIRDARYVSRHIAARLPVSAQPQDSVDEYVAVS
jgi:hypothetical protein